MWVVSSPHGTSYRVQRSALQHLGYRIRAHCRDVQYAGIACVRELGAAGPRSAAVLRSSGVGSLVSKALEMFGETDEELRKQANIAMRYVEYAGGELH